MYCTYVCFVVLLLVLNVLLQLIHLELAGSSNEFIKTETKILFSRVSNLVLVQFQWFPNETSFGGHPMHIQNVPSQNDLS